MATEEERDTPDSDSSSGLKELFSMGEEEAETDVETSEGADKDPSELEDESGPESTAESMSEPGASEDSGSTTAAPMEGSADSDPGGTSSEFDDAEILTDEAASSEPESAAASGGESETMRGASTTSGGPNGDGAESSAVEEQPAQAGTSAAEPDAAVSDDAEIVTDRTKPERPGPEAGNGDEETTVRRSASNRLTTGITMLDRELEGGIPPGRMLSLVAPPETQSELIVKEMAVSRPTVYISTFRPEWEIREELHDHLQKTDDERLIGNELEVSYVDPERLLADPKEYIDDLPKGSNLIIDSINEFELEERRRYVEFLNHVKEVLWDTGSVGLFYGIEEATDPPARSLTLKRSDLVWQLDRDIKAGEIQTELIISKFRGGKALTEPVKLVLTDDVQVDMSRDIG